MGTAVVDKAGRIDAAASAEPKRLRVLVVDGSWTCLFIGPTVDLPARERFAALERLADRVGIAAEVVPASPAPPAGNPRGACGAALPGRATPDRARAARVRIRFA